jgi:hypothetical protein
MGDQEESGVDDHTSNRNPSAATARSRGWQGGGGLGTHRLHQHHRGHREAGAQAHRGKYIFIHLYMCLFLCSILLTTRICNMYLPTASCAPDWRYV